MTTPRNPPVSGTIVAMTIALLAGCSSDPGEIPDAGDIPDGGTFVRHEWVIDQVVVSGKKEPLSDGGVTDQPLHVHFGRGSAAFSPPGESEEAFGEVHATADGKTYWTDAVAPEAELGNPESPMEVRSRLIETHAFLKVDAGASLKMTITAVTLESIDENIHEPNAEECGSTTARNCTWVTHAEITGNVYAGTANEKLDEFDFNAFLRGFRENWESGAQTTRDFTDPQGHPSFDWFANVLGDQEFEFDDDVTGTGGEIFARVRLARPARIEIPLDKVPVGEIVFLKVDVTSSALNRRDGEVFVSAHFRDPLELQGTSLDFTGLEPIPVPDDFPRFPRLTPEEAPPCSTASDPEAGTLQFGQAELSAPEGLQGFALIPVTRVGGSKGVVSAKLSSSDGTAIAGTDYVGVDTVIRFGDGVSGTQFLKIPVLDNLIVDGDRTVSLRLSSPKGCAVLGDPAEASLTIFDNDQPVAPPPTFTVGGTVSGLLGSGLVLRDVLQQETVAVTGNGPFAFPTPRLDRTEYDVRVDVQPSNPLQACSVLNGTGTLSGGNAGNIAVTCITLPPSGGLDPSFGDHGRAVTTVPYSPNLLRGRIGMALQSDGKILMVGGLKLVRLNTDGTPDGTFGTQGVVDVVFENGTFDTAMDVVVQSDGKIVVAGTTSTTAIGSDNFALTRFDSRGALDTTFGTGGHVTTDFFGSTDQARRMVLQSDDKIIVVGSAFHPVSPVSGSTLFAIVRYDADGTPDPTFAVDGKTTDSPGQVLSFAGGVTIQSDGNIVVAGSTAPNGGEDGDTGVVRYLGDGHVKLPGTRDETFGPMSDGTLEAPVDQSVDVVTLSDGTILTAVQVNAGLTGTGNLGFGLAHIPATGLPPPRLPQPVITFTSEGDFPKAMLKQSNGQIVVVGQSGGFSTNPDMAIARFDETGFRPDTSFGTDGKQTIDFFGHIDSAEAVVQQTDHKLVVGGFARSGAGNVFVAIRLAP